MKNLEINLEALAIQSFVWGGILGSTSTITFFYIIWDKKHAESYDSTIHTDNLVY
jgi:hypothetical protein